jgi:hypothetical protein
MVLAQNGLWLWAILAVAVAYFATRMASEKTAAAKARRKRVDR